LLEGLFFQQLDIKFGPFSTQYADSSCRGG